MYDHEGFQGSHEPPRPTLFQRLKSFVSSHFTSKAADSAGALEPKERYNDLKIQEAHSVIGALFTIIGAAVAYLMSHDISELIDLRNIDFSSLTFSSAILDIVINYWDSFAILISAGAIPICVFSIAFFNCKLKKLKQRSLVEENQYRRVVAQERAIAQAEALSRIAKNEADIEAAQAHAKREQAEEMRAKAETKTQEDLSNFVRSLNEAVPSFTDAAHSISSAAQSFGDYYKLKTDLLKDNSVQAKTTT